MVTQTVAFLTDTSAEQIEAASSMSCHTPYGTVQTVSNAEIMSLLIKINNRIDDVFVALGELKHVHKIHQELTEKQGKKLAIIDTIVSSIKK